MSCPLGLLAVIFEARPDAVTQISSLAIKSANARDPEARPRGRAHGAGAGRKPSARRCGRSTAIPEALVTNIQQRARSGRSAQARRLVDLVIPRGSYELVRHVQSHTRIPVLGHSEGVCHIYVDAAANFDMALAIIDDAKTDYPAACNAVETVLVHQAIAASFLPALAARMTRARRAPARLPR